MGERVGVREMALRRGCSHGAVQKAIKDGRIPAEAVERDAKGRITSIDYEAATAAWNVNTDADQAARTPGGAATVAGQLPLEPRSETKRTAPAPAVETLAVRAANAQGKQLQNQLLELELLKEMGTLVSRDEVREIAARRYRAIREQVLTVPDRVADILAAERDAARVHSILIAELERALHELSDAAEAESAGLARRAAAERVAA